MRLSKNASVSGLCVSLPSLGVLAICLTVNRFLGRLPYPRASEPVKLEDS